MTKLSLFKHGLTAVTLCLFIVGLIQLLNLDVSAETFGKTIVSGIFFLSLSITTAIYRIHWINQQKINEITLGLYLLTLSGLLVMFLNPKNIFALWRPTMATFILLSGYILYMKINRRNWGALSAKVLLWITTGLFLYPLVVKTTSADYFGVCGYCLGSVGLFSLIHLFLPEKQR